MVERVAKNVRWMFAPHIDIRDLTQAGNVGLLNAAACYDPSKGKGSFEPYAWFRVRGAIIDSQKRRTYREELNVSLQAIAESNDGWLPPALDTDRGELPEDVAADEEIRKMLAVAIAGLPALEQRAIAGHLAGESLSTMAKAMGRSLAATRATLDEARECVTAAVRRGNMTPKQKRTANARSGDFGAAGRREGRKTAERAGKLYPPAWEESRKKAAQIQSSTS
jgi:RNA polymerase sigma factor (sigma-70 family)